LILTITAVLGLLALISEARYARTLGVLSVSTNWRIALLAAGCMAAVLLLLMVFSWTPAFIRWMPAISRIARAPCALGRWALIATALLSLALPAVVTGPYGRFLQPFF
jgi:hypothetical protein